MKRYLYLVLVITALIVGGVGTFNYMVDPFLLYHHRDGGDEVLGRIDQFYNMRLYKPYHVSRRKPEAVIVGTSRSGSIRAKHHEWDHLRTYNFAMPGMTIYELSQLVKHAQSVQPLSSLLIGLDYHALVRAVPKSRPGFEPARLARTPSDFHSPRYIAQWFRDLQAFLFSFDILQQSLHALDRSVTIPRVYYSDGAWKGVSKMLVGRGGYIYVARSAVDSIESTPFRLEDNLPYIRDILHYCYSQDIDTTLFFTPTHVFFVDLWFRIATEELWRDMHREILAINAEIAGEYGRPPFEIWGFGDEAAVVAEPIYRSKDIEKAWFLDGAHYGTRLGERIMGALLGQGSDFGKTLTPGNIEQYLDSVDSIRAQFISSNQKQVARLHETIGNVPPMAQ